MTRDDAAQLLSLLLDALRETDPDPTADHYHVKLLRTRSVLTLTRWIGELYPDVLIGRMISDVREFAHIPLYDDHDPHQWYAVWGDTYNTYSALVEEANRLSQIISKLPQAVPLLTAQLNDTDIAVSLWIAGTLSRSGLPCVRPVLESYSTRTLHITDDNAIVRRRLLQMEEWWRAGRDVASLDVFQGIEEGADYA